MKHRIAQLRFTYIIAGILTILSIFFSFVVIDAHALDDTEQPSEAASFEELKSWLDENQSTGGTIALTQDITVPAEESYTFTNGRYRKEITVETQGHTIYVEGYLTLWPFLTIRGDGSKNELIHVRPGGELRLVSVCIDAGEDGIAIVQEDGAFFLYGSEEGMGLPEFSCTGQIVSSQTTTAAAYWYYNLEELPIIRIPDGGEFTPDMLPPKILALVNRDFGESEEEVPVFWDENTFPSEQKRTLVQGCFADGYTQYEDYAPRCLVVWESDESPFFLNVYLEHATQWYDMVFIRGEATQAGTVSIQSSDDGETWTEITGTEGYQPILTAPNEELAWILSYPRTDRPRYYRMVLRLEDGTEHYSEALELTDDFFFTAADIEGGRGGETSPNAGESLLPEDGIWGSGSTDDQPPLSSYPSAEEDQSQNESGNPADAATETQVSSGEANNGTTDSNENTSESFLETGNERTNPAKDFLKETEQSDPFSTAEQSDESDQFRPAETQDLQPSDPEHTEQTNDTQNITTSAKNAGNVQILIGTGIVGCILIAAIAVSILCRRK